MSDGDYYCRATNTVQTVDIVTKTANCSGKFENRLKTRLICTDNSFCVCSLLEMAGTSAVSVVYVFSINLWTISSRRFLAHIFKTYVYSLWNPCFTILPKTYPVTFWLIVVKATAHKPHSMLSVTLYEQAHDQSRRSTKGKPGIALGPGAEKGPGEGHKSIVY